MTNNPYERFVNYRELSNTFQYVVKQGDSLYSIGKEYNVSVNDLINLNKLSSTMIYPNQILFIPTKTPTSGYIEYITKSGDTLNKIIKDNNISIGAIDKYNNLLDLELAPNQVIKLDKVRTTKYYVIKPGDSLNSILITNALTPAELIEFNKSTWLKPDEKIIVG